MTGHGKNSTQKIRCSRHPDLYLQEIHYTLNPARGGNVRIRYKINEFKSWATDQAANN